MAGMAHRTTPKEKGKRKKAKRSAALPTILSFCLLPFAFVLPALAQDAQQDVKRQVWSVEQRRVEALIMSDWKALESLLSDDLVYTHSDGTVEDKAAFMKAVRTGAMVYESMQHEDVLVRLFGEAAAVITGRTRVRVRRAGGERLEAALRVTIVYANEDGWWRLAAWQTTRLPEKAPE
jgi:uncharacterized protein (TIGR02246 family)